MREFIARRKRQEREQSDRQIMIANRKRIERQARALVREQAEP